MTALNSNNNSSSPSSGKKAACDNIAKSTSVCEVGAALNHLTEEYYKDVLAQAKVSFRCAIAAAVVGTGIFLIGVPSVMNPEKSNNVEASPPLTPNISLVAGALVEVIAGINFYLYARTSRQFSSFHICLERANRFLLVNMVCHELSNSEDQDSMRKKLAEAMMYAPMLTIAQVTGGLEQAEPHRKGKRKQATQEVVCSDEEQVLQDNPGARNGTSKHDEVI